MQTVTLHRQPNGDPDSARIVEDGFRLSVFLVPPAALLARGLWGACLAWLVFVIAVAGAVFAGVLSPLAALAAIVVVDAVLAIDVPDLERRRLQRRGWSSLILSGLPGVAGPALPQDVPPPVPPLSSAVPPKSPDVIGLFPDERR